MANLVITPVQALASAIRVHVAILRHPDFGPRLAAEGKTGSTWLYEDPDGTLITMAHFGTKTEKTPGQRIIVQEKLTRVRKMNWAEGHILSRESRNRALDMYGGAVLAASHHGASVSGFPELVDEIASFAWHVDLGAMTERKALQILGIKPNSEFNLDLPATRALFQRQHD